ncbi:hypothetical protein GCM10027600_34990 [Nocardioides ginsengisegetis]
MASPGDPAATLGRAVGFLLRGNWAGAILVAAATVGTAGVLSTILTLVWKPKDFGLDNTLTVIATLLANSFGADALATSEMKRAHGSVTIGAWPLTVTIMTLTVAVLVWRRINRRNTSALQALTDAARTGLVAALPVTAFSIVFRSDNGDLGPSWAGDFADEFFRVTWGASALSAFIMTFVTVTVVLAASVVMRKDWLPARVSRLHDWVAPPLAGFAAMTIALPVAGLIGVLAILLVGDSQYTDTSTLNTDEWMSLVASAVTYLGNAGLALVSLGTMGKLGVSGSYHASWGGRHPSDSYDVSHGLHWFTSTWGEPGLWIAVVVTPLWLALGATVAIRRARRIRETALAHQQYADQYPGHFTPQPTSAVSPVYLVSALAAWVATLLVTAPMLAHLAAGHGNVSLHGDLGFLFYESGRATVTASGTLGPVGFASTTVLITMYGAVIALLVALVFGALTTQQLRQRATAFAASAQEYPGPQAPHTARQPYVPPTRGEAPSMYGQPSGAPATPPPYPPATTDHGPRA